MGKLEPTAEDNHLRADRPALAASLAVQLIRMGVRAVVAAGWEVNDGAAKLFAQEFYRGLLDGDPFGEVVQRARSDIYAAYPTDSTWGAYQCYGRPDYRLPSAQATERHSPSLDFASPAEAVSVIERVAALGEVGGERDRGADLAELARIEQMIAKRDWSKRAEIQSALAAAFAQLKEFGQAIDRYRAAATAEEATLPVRAVEQCLNLSARVAAEGRDTEAAEVIKRAIEALDALTKACGPTQERLSLIGSAYKRLAQITIGDARTEALLEMERAYRSAREVGQKRGGADVFYPWSQELTAKVVVALRRGRTARLDLTEIRGSLPPRDDGDFWRLVMPVDLTFLKLLADGALAKTDQDKVIEEYLAVWRHTGSGREMSSIVEQMGFHINMLDDPGLPAEPRRSALLAALNAVRERLERATKE
jgi:hypothetical protein